MTLDGRVESADLTETGRSGRDGKWQGKWLLLNASLTFMASLAASIKVGLLPA